MGGMNETNYGNAVPEAIGMAAKAVPFFSWITAQADGTEHAVTDEAQVAGMEAGDGVFEAMCGTRFLVACLEVGPRDRCSDCCAFLRAQAEMRDLDERMTRPSWLRRLFCHRSGRHTT